MKILLTGVDGQVGFELARSLAPLGELLSGSRRAPASGAEHSVLRFDLAEPASMMQVLQAQRPEVIVNAAAYTAVDRAESEPELAQRVNAIAPAELAQWCADHGALLVHFSTDYVFDGRPGAARREHDPTGPLGVYGRSKLEGEAAIRASGCRHLILRTAWVYAARGQNFLRTMLRLGGERERLGVVADQRGSPTTARGLASVVALLLARGEHLHGEGLGTFHVSHAGDASWHEFACAIFAQAVDAGLLARAPQVDAIASADYPTPARRPAWSVLDGSRLRAVHGLQLPDWRVGLRQVIAELSAD